MELPPELLTGELSTGDDDRASDATLAVEDPTGAAAAADDDDDAAVDDDDDADDDDDGILEAKAWPVSDEGNDKTGPTGSPVRPANGDLAASGVGDPGFTPDDALVSSALPAALEPAPRLPALLRSRSNSSESSSRLRSPPSLSFSESVHRGREDSSIE